MASFAIISEGATDQRVIDNLIHGYLQADEDEPVINYVQPPFQPSDAPAGWTLVMQALQSGRVGEALAFNDYVVVHIDTDVCEEKGFDVSRRAPDGRERTVDELIDAVVIRLQREIGPVAAEHADQILFAIAVNSIECWLLPLLFENQKAKAAKTTGCLTPADDALKAARQPGLLKDKQKGKNVDGYQQASAAYAKKKTLLKHRQKNPSLDRFVRHLEAMQPPPP